MTDINTNTSHAVYVLGDVDTCRQADILAATAAQHGAVVGQAFAFGLGEAAGTQDLSTVDAVVEALGTAVATGTDVWMPCWLQDLRNEQHLRSLSSILQRHQLNLLLGPDLKPCPVRGGLSRLDAAVRDEIRAVFALDDAVMAAAGMWSLGAEIEVALAEAAAVDRPGDVETRERRFSTAETAALLGKSTSWVSRGLREKAFVFPDGTPVGPLRQRDGRGHCFTVPMVRAIALSAFRRGSLGGQRLEEVLAALAGP